MPRIVWWVVTAMLAAPAVATGQPRTAYPERRGVSLSQFPRVLKLADNVYGYEEIRQPGFTTVSLFVVGANGVLIADGQGSPEATRKLLEAISKTTARPVRWYIVGSDHGDHTAGNSVLPKDVTYIVHPASRAQLERDAAAAAKAPQRPDQPARPAVVVPPVAMTGDKQVVDVGGIEVHALFLGRAHTGGDLMVHLPKQRILFMSEAYLNRVFPAMRSAYPSEWVKTIDRALAMKVDRFVPGHGFIEDPKASREELLEFQKALKYVIGEVSRLHEINLSADEAARQANWGSYKDWMLAEQQGPVAVRRVYEELEGKLPQH
jgi:glyoxylase-like metal-dependent hydrolase (beta-lactamase superfamily II)